MPEHTKLPWVSDTWQIYAQGHLIAECKNEEAGSLVEDITNARLIVKCVNERDGLVDALKAMLRVADADERGDPDRLPGDGERAFVNKMARNALAKLEATHE